MSYSREVSPKKRETTQSSSSRDVIREEKGKEEKTDEFKRDKVKKADALAYGAPFTEKTLLLAENAAKYLKERDPITKQARNEGIALKNKEEIEKNERPQAQDTRARLQAKLAKRKPD